MVFQIELGAALISDRRQRPLVLCDQRRICHRPGGVHQLRGDHLSGGAGARCAPRSAGVLDARPGAGYGVDRIAMSLRYRVPIAMAWSTSGAAMLITSASGV